MGGGRLGFFEFHNDNTSPPLNLFNKETISVIFLRICAHYVRFLEVGFGGSA
jgi:hypothetical protein